MQFRELMDKFCRNGVVYEKAEDISLLNNYKQLGAADLEALRCEKGDIKLLPSSNNDGWFTTTEKASKYICEGEVFTMGRARHPNLKYVKGKFVSSNNIIIESKDENKILTRFLYHFIRDKVEDFYVETSTYPKFDIQKYKNLLVPVPPILLQKEIVRILDNYSLLIEKLFVEKLLRQKQYDFYLDKLLSYNEGDLIEKKELGEMIQYIQPGKYIVSSTDYSDDYKTPVLTAGQSFILGYTNETKGIFMASKKNPVIIFDDFTATFHWVDFDFKIKSSAMKILKMKNENIMLFRYLYHFMKTYRYLPATHSRQWIEKYSKFKASIPDNNTLIKTVKLLDNLEKIISDKKQGIPKEIELRSSEYAYYQKYLMNFKRRKNDEKN